jgi:hypothetical protein
MVEHVERRAMDERRDCCFGTDPHLAAALENLQTLQEKTALPAHAALEQAGLGALQQRARDSAPPATQSVREIG